MSGPIDPALRALKVLEDFTYPQGPAPTAAEVEVDAALGVIRQALRAAAEAAPLDVEAYEKGRADALRDAEERVRVLDIWRWEDRDAVLAVLAALRSPDTETAGEAG